MTLEKIAKAYLWRAGKPATRSHLSFAKFIYLLGDQPSLDLQRIAPMLGYKTIGQLKAGLRSFLPLSRAIEILAPALSADGPNVEYPWPHLWPTESPATYAFPIWSGLYNKADGRALLSFVEKVISNFDQIA